MEFSITTANTDDAEDLFLLAKDRLLDVNEWHKISGDHITYTLTDSHKQKVHRNAHSHDHIRITGATEQWLQVSRIIYDDFPDIAGETVTLLLDTPVGTEETVTHAIIIKRVGKIVAVSAENFEIAAVPLLKGIIANSEYAIAS